MQLWQCSPVLQTNVKYNCEIVLWTYQLSAKQTRNGAQHAVHHELVVEVLHCQMLQSQITAYPLINQLKVGIESTGADVTDVKSNGTTEAPSATI
jgi:hypothetical protein